MVLRSYFFIYTCIIAININQYNLSLLLDCNCFHLVKINLLSLISQTLIPYIIRCAALYYLVGSFGWQLWHSHCTMWICQNLHLAAATAANACYYILGRHKLECRRQTSGFFLALHAVKSATFYAINQQHTRTQVWCWNKKLVSHPTWQRNRSKLQRRIVLLKWLV